MDIRLVAAAMLLLPALSWAQADVESIETIPVQSLPDAPPEPAPSDGPRQLDEVVVTVQKTRQSARKVPVSLTALQGELIRETGAVDLAEVSLYVPNVRVDADDIGSPQVFIRGFGTNAFNPSFESSVGFVQDEIFFGRPGYFTEAMFDIDRVEVLRGPQNTLFGKNTIAGVFNVVSKGPGSGGGQWGADGRYTYGEHGERRFEGGMGGMFADWGGVRFSALKRQQTGQLHNQFLQRDEEALKQDAYRFKVKLLPLENVDSELTAVVSDTKAPFWPFQLANLDADTRSYLEGFDPDIEDDPTNFITSMETPGFISKGSETLGLKTQWSLGSVAGLSDFNTVLVLGGSKFHIDQLNDLDVSPADIARLDNHEKHRQFSTELRFSGKGDSLFGLGTGIEFVGGLFQFSSNYSLLARILSGRDLATFATTNDARQLLVPPELSDLQVLLEQIPTLPGVPGLGDAAALITDGDYYQFDYLQDIQSTALFGQLTWSITDRLSITPGLRLNREKKRIDTAGNSFCNGKEATAALGLARPCIIELLLESEDYNLKDLRRKEFDLSPKIALQYFADHGINYYTSWTKGAKSGGFNSISFTGEDLEYEAEKARTFEVGAKGQFFKRRLNINLTLYDTQFDNLQVLAFNGVFFDVSNAASAVSRGLEADFSWRTPYDPLRLSGSLGLLSAKYKNYSSAPAPVSEGLDETQDLSGRRIAFSPDRTATLTPSLSYPIGPVVATLAADAIYQGEQYTDTDLDPNTRVAGHFIYAARFILAHPLDYWALSVGGSNLADKRVLNQVTDATFFPGTYFAQQAGGRQLFASFSLRF